MDENNNKRISFSMKRRRILIYRSTLRALGVPKNVRFLLNKDAKRLAVQACEPIDRDSFKVPDYMGNPKDQYEITSIGFLTIIYKMMGWGADKTFRVAGEVFPENRLVEFDLKDAEIISDAEFVDIEGEDN